jgi:hypothetical protein
MADNLSFYLGHHDRAVREAPWLAARVAAGASRTAPPAQVGKFAHLAGSMPVRETPNEPATPLPIPSPKPQSPPAGSVAAAILASAAKARTPPTEPTLPADPVARQIVLAGRRRRELAGEKV